MVIKILANIDHLELDGVADFILSHGMGISRNQEIKKQFFSDEVFISAIGDLNNASLNRDSVYACAIINKKNGFAPAGREISDIKDYLQGILSCLWFVKDNSVSIADFYSHATDGEQHSFSASAGCAKASNSYGEYASASFSKADLEHARKVASQYKSLLKQVPENQQDAEELLGMDSSDPQSAGLMSSYYMHSYDGDNRIERAMKFLQVARAAEYVSYKIALYIPVLECLFGSGIKQGITHGVARRVARYIGADKADRLNIFDNIREAWAVKSIYNHGGGIGNDVLVQDQHRELARETDGILRRVLTRVIMQEAHIFLQDDAVLDAYFDELVLS